MMIARRMSPKVTLFFGLGTSMGSCDEAMLDVGSEMRCQANVVWLESVCYKISS